MAALGTLPGCGTDAVNPRPEAPPGPLLQLPALHASADRITTITVCTRPFRAQGPRLEVETLGDQRIVHNYGHGGSGWSLSWGSSAVAVEKARESGDRDFAVIGCGALGLTSALLLQRSGGSVTIYAKELPPQVRSSLASGVWSPDSRICLEHFASPAFKLAWEAMTRKSYDTYQTFLGLPGEPVEYVDIYSISEAADLNRRRDEVEDTRPAFAALRRDLTDDLMPRGMAFRPGKHPFGPRQVKRSTTLMFNLTAYGRLLMNDFLANGGRIQVMEFHTPADLTRLPQRTLINATGYGARALFGDETVTPVRGQLARMIPQPDIHYGLYYDDVSFLPRRDGLVFQYVGESDYFGFDDATTLPDRREAERAVNTIARLFPG